MNLYLIKKEINFIATSALWESNTIFPAQTLIDVRRSMITGGVECTFIQMKVGPQEPLRLCSNTGFAYGCHNLPHIKLKYIIYIILKSFVCVFVYLFDVCKLSSLLTIHPKMAFTLCVMTINKTEVKSKRFHGSYSVSYLGSLLK